MADTSHGYPIAETTEDQTDAERKHFLECMECRREVGEARRKTGRRAAMDRHPSGRAVSLPQLYPATSSRADDGFGVKLNVRPKVFVEKTWPVEAVPIRADQIQDIAQWCGAQVVEAMDVVPDDEKFELRLPSFEGLLVGTVGDYVLRYRHSGRFDIMKKAAFEDKYEQTGVRGGPTGL
jgi:hypothetical protein